jgi:hypothetical protein
VFFRKLFSRAVKARKEWGFSPCAFVPFGLRTDLAMAAAKALTILTGEWHD